MKYYIGIDLGTTNSAICSYDGQIVRIWKSPDQNDVTPSAIHVDKRGNRFYGMKAYNQAPYYPENSAVLFKRYMGTNEHLELKSANLSLTPEECSAEILKVLFGYLPEEIRRDPDTATVITVPAAFNQMKKAATLQAAELAGIGKVALMQEPVAAIMSVMKNSSQEGIFLIYDLGGGTFDVSIAENIGGKVNLLASGGIEYCGGRDIDRMMTNKIVIPWLKAKFSLPDEFEKLEKYKSLYRLCQWATERAKIELSSIENSTIALGENEARSIDLKGEEIYVDIDVTRSDLDGIISDLISDTIKATRETMSKAGLTSNDIEKIVFVGGPTNYKPLRDKVASELALPPNIDVNPMTAVAEGASIFAESIDWSTTTHNRKASNAELKTNLDISFRYEARSSAASAKVVFLAGKGAGYLVQITSIETGWISGRAELRNGLTMDLPLSKNNENRFDVTVYDSFGRIVPLQENRIVITRTLATIGAITASHSIMVEAHDKLGGVVVPVYIVKEGDTLPKKGHVSFKNEQSLKAGSSASININLREGSIENPTSDNFPIGSLKIMGTDFADGIIPTGADIECDFEMSDSGAIRLCVSIPCIGANFGDRNFYSRQDGQNELSDTARIAESGQQLLERIDSISEKVSDTKLDQARAKAHRAASLENDENDTEDIQKIVNGLQEAKNLLDQIRKEHSKEIHQVELDYCIAVFDKFVRKFAKPIEEQAFDNLARAAQRSIDRNDTDFDNQLSDMKSKSFAILFKQDWFVINYFNRMIVRPHEYSDAKRFEELKQAGNAFIKKDQIDELRNVISELFRIHFTENTGESMLEIINIIKG